MTFRAASTALLTLSLMTAAATALAATLTGSGRSVTEERAVAGYTGIALSIPGRVEVVQGATEGIRITADDNVLPEIESVVEGGILKLRFRKRLTSVNKARILVIVNAKTIESLAVAGSGDIHAPALTARRLAINIAGSGDVKVAGRAEALDGSIAGSGDLDAGKLDTQRVKVSVAGSGDAVVWARQALKVSVVGSGDIRYYGDPTVERSAVGSGSVRRLGAAPS
jgi:uncharacterized Zn-binding protein involved in type VI secretion